MATTRQEKNERKAKILPFVAITMTVMAMSEITKITVFINLVYSAFLWAILWFLYVFVRDLIIGFSWKKPEFPLPQYEEEDREIARLNEDEWSDLGSMSNIENPISVFFTHKW